MKKLLIIFLFLFLVPLINAEQQSLGTFKSGTKIILVQICSNCTYNNISSLIYPNGTSILNNINMTRSGTYYYFTLNNNQTVERGRYIINGFGDLNGGLTVWSYDLTVTGSGDTQASDGLSIFIFILFIIISIGLLYSFVMQLAKVATGSMTIYDVIISWSFLITLLTINWLSRAYLVSNFIPNLTDLYLNIATWTNGALPLITFFISFFWRSIEKKRPLNVDEMLGRRILRNG